MDVPSGGLDSWSERRRKFVTGLVFRAVVCAAFIAVFLFNDRLARGMPAAAFDLPVAILAFGILCNWPYWLLGRRFDFPLAQFYAHWFVDLFVITGVLYCLGGVDVPSAPLAYLMTIITSAIFISRRASYAVATGSAVAFSLMVAGEAWGWIPHRWTWAHHFSPAAQVFVVLCGVAFFYIFAYLAGTLADELRRANRDVRSAKRRIQEQNRLLEQRVRERTQALEERNREVEEFVHIVTHDLKNSSVAATEMARKLMRAEGSRLSERGRRYAGHLLEDARAMNLMLANLLALFRVGGQGGERSWVELGRLVEELLQAQGGRIENKGIAVEVGDLPPVYANEAQLRHVLGNLIDNACKYVGDKVGARIEVGARVEGGAHVVWVRDNGIGIPPHQQERIFQLFHRAPRQEVGGVAQEGHGVGLAIARRMVDRWGGRLWLESEPGRGSVFYFTIPRPAREEAA